VRCFLNQRQSTNGNSSLLAFMTVKGKAIAFQG
jgi:hypothetical protein